jgi:hypothetical protein
VDERIAQWKGGRLRVYRRERRLRLRKGKKAPRDPAALSPAEFRATFEPYLVAKLVDGNAEAVPLGNGLALLLDPDESRPHGEQRTSGVLGSGLRFEVAVRNGRPECVAIRAEPDGPPVTTTGLRVRVDEAVRELVEATAVRLELDKEGDVIGVLATSPFTASDTTIPPERAGDVRRRLAETAPKRGRPRLSDEHLREVLAEYEKARAQRRPAARAIAERWHVTPETARQWVYKARRRFDLTNTKGGQDV